VSLTKRDFEAVARAIHAMRDNPDLTGPEARAMDRIIRAVAAGLAQTNPRFDPGRFFEATGYDK
jgi:hypothetical protein